MDDNVLHVILLNENGSSTDGDEEESDEEDLINWILQDDSEDEEDNVDEEGRRLRLLINPEMWKRLGDPSFEEHFRMDRATFDLLLLAVGNHLNETGRWQRASRRGLDYSLMMVLWILASPDTFRSVGVKFGVCKGEVHFHYKYIIECLREMAGKYVQWPSPYEMELIAARLEDLYGYPSVCGCIDGCHIRITAPLEQQQRYVDRHHSYSILLQGVCDDGLVFRDIYVGQPGSVGDKRTFKRSPLGQNILRDPNVVRDKHLLGDGGYTLTNKLIIPYRNVGHLTARQRTHNYYLSRCRSCIERAFGLLKGKWRRLKYFPNYCLEYAIDHIVACVVLHNFILLQGNAYLNREEVDVAALPNVNPDQLLRQAKADGILKRNHIAALLDERD